MRKAAILICSILNYLTVTHAQHWEGVGGGTDQHPHIVRTLLNFNNNLVVGGAFDSLGYTGIYSMGLGYWNNNNWISGNTLFSSGYPSIAKKYNDELIIGGDFRRINGNKYCNKVARLDSSGWVPLGSGVTNGEVRAMASYNGDLYVGGIFTIVDSTIMARRIARWDGNDWHAIGNGITGGFGVVNCMAVFQNQLYIAGDFGAIDGMPARNICRWNGSSWDSVDTGVFGLVYSMYVDSINNRLYVGGIFAQTGSVPTPTGVAYWDGVNWYPAGTEPFVPAKCLIKHNGILYNGTTQTGITNSLGDTINNICWLDGNVWRNVGEGISAEPVVFSEFQNELYVGGYFSHAGDSLVNGIAKWIPGSLGVGENAEDKLQMKVMPNPAKEEVIMELNLKRQMNLELLITDTNGNTIFKESLSGNGTVMHKINTSEYTSGMYLFSVYENRKLQGSEKVVINR